MKKTILLLTLVSTVIIPMDRATTQRRSSEVVTMAEVKELFDAKIEWNKGDHIYHSTATVPGLPYLSTVHAPETMRQDFEDFFNENQKNKDLLIKISLAIKVGQMMKLNKPERKIVEQWPPSVQSVVHIYTEPQSDCAIV